MKKIITLIIVILFSSIGFAQRGAKIEFKTENNTIDYGTIAKGSDTGIRVFEFTNTGDATLVIFAIQSTSNVTIMSKSKDSILPGQTAKIEVKYNLVLGPIRKTITVESNAVNYDDGRVPLKIKGEVVAN
jgi:hypothetical protein